VFVDYGKVALVLVLQLQPGFDNAQVIADMDETRGLDARDDDFISR